MKKKEKRRRGGKSKHRVERLANSIRKRVEDLEAEADKFTEETYEAYERGYTIDEYHAIKFTYLSTPLKLLTIAARTVIDSLPEESGIDRDRLFKINEMHRRTGGEPHELAENLLGLLRECYDYIGKERASKATEETEEAPTVH